MSEEQLKQFFADVELLLNIKLGQFCDRNNIFRSDFTNFRKGNKYWTSLTDLNIMKEDILNNINKLLDLYKNIG